MANNPFSAGPRERLLYSPRVFDPNTPKARASGEPEEVDNELYLECVARRAVGEVVRSFAAAPGTGFWDYRITRIDATGVYAVEVACTVRELTISDVY